MGAWGCGPLENDTAADVVLDLREASPHQVQAIIRELMNEACECLFASSGEALVALAYWITHSEGATSVGISVRQKLGDLLDRVLDVDGSELAQLWLEADEDEYRQWADSVKELRMRLR